MSVNEENRQQGKPKGLILKEARDQQGISLQTVHDNTKIPLDVLKAIEEGYTVRTLSPFYLKGFMKMYAQYLGVDIQQVLEDYQPEQLPDPIQGDIEKEEDHQEKITQMFPRERQQLLVKIGAGLLLLFFLVRIFGCMTQKVGKAFEKRSDARERRSRVVSKEEIQKKVSAVSVDKKADTSKKAVPQSTPSPAPVLQAVAKPKPEPVTVKKEGVTLTVTVKEKGWLQVKADGNLVFQSALKQGDTETWEAKTSIELSGKSIHNLEYVVNGQDSGSLGRADRNARRVVVTRDGLAVKK